MVVPLFFLPPPGPSWPPPLPAVVGLLYKHCRICLLPLHDARWGLKCGVGGRLGGAPGLHFPHCIQGLFVRGRRELGLRSPYRIQGAVPLCETPCRLGSGPIGGRMVTPPISPRIPLL